MLKLLTFRFETLTPLAGYFKANMNELHECRMSVVVLLVVSLLTEI